jgi:hypothetical protein
MQRPGCRFKRDVEEKKLTGIIVPEVYLAGNDVLVTEWIDGELQQPVQGARQPAGSGCLQPHYACLVAWFQMLHHLRHRHKQRAEQDLQ